MMQRTDIDMPVLRPLYTLAWNRTLYHSNPHSSSPPRTPTACLITRILRVNAQRNTLKDEALEHTCRGGGAARGVHTRNPVRVTDMGRVLRTAAKTLRRGVRRMAVLRAGISTAVKATTILKEKIHSTDTHSVVAVQHTSHAHAHARACVSCNTGLPLLTPSAPGSMHTQKQTKTFNSGDSPVVTHLTTSPPVRCLNRAERTGSLVFNVLWSNVEYTPSKSIHVITIPNACLTSNSSCLLRGSLIAKP
jgi:hypothetical protein